MKTISVTTFTKYISALFLITFLLFSTGCGKSGAIEDPISYVTPSIQNLQTKTTNIAKSVGGILSFTCDWTSPETVNSAKAYLSFVRTIDLPVTEPIGVIGSASDMIISKSSRAVMSNLPQDFSDNIIRFSIAQAERSAQTTASATINDPIAVADFYRKYAEPILIPVKINTEESAGQFYAQIPFTTIDIASAPLGVHQMLLYMKINGHKTNTLAFELTFVP